MTVNDKKRWPAKQQVSRGLEWIFWGELLVLDAVTKWQSQMHDLVVMNYGGVFGVLPSIWWGIGLFVVWLLVCRYWITSKKTGLERWALGLIVIGGLGNIIDRIWFGAVRDFIYYPLLGFYGNLADIYLVLGVGLTIMVELLHENRT